MNTFTDSKGREWTLTITAHSAKFLRECGLNLSWKDPAASVLADWQAISALVGESPEKIVTVVAHLAAEQIRERKLTPEDFASGFNGPTFEAACVSLMHARAEWAPTEQLRGWLRGVLKGDSQQAQASDETGPRDEVADAIAKG